MKKTLSVILGLSLLAACQNGSGSATETATTETAAVSENPLAWTDHANIYEVNIRQYTPEGTINAFTAHLDRLQALGVDVLWIMPIQPIGMENRKGGLGSYYSIADYTAVNPNFGTMDDFKAMVNAAHERGMKVILDWVANHTAFDHPWTVSHPEWYTHDSTGAIIPPVADWSDVADLNYEEKGLWTAMRNEMKFWINEADIDGFRCDVAMMVPLEFWNETRVALDSIKPVFMLAEAEGPEFHSAFDMTYGWELHHILNEIAKGEMDFGDLGEFLDKEDSLYREEALRMNFVTNHDENSWNGTAYERMGDNVQNFYLICIGMKRSMPLIYSGQEAGLNKRLAFFEKDTIDWSDESQYEFYKKALALKKNHPALATGANPAELKLIATDDPKVIGYSRTIDGKTVSFYLNFSDADYSLDLQKSWSAESAQNYMSGSDVDLSSAYTLPAHGHLILVSK